MYRAKAADDGSVETTVYIALAALGPGVGRALYVDLLTTLEAEPDLHRAYAGIALPNDASVRRHHSCGFTAIGLFTEAGRKFDS